MDLRRRAIDLFSQDWDVLLDLLNRFMFWRGSLANDAQVSLHNAAESYVAFLMGPPDPANLDVRYHEQLETLMGDVRPVDKGMSGASYQGVTKPRRKRKAEEQ